MARAAMEFEIPANTQVLMVHPEWLCHDICSLEKDWQTASEGVRMPCPHCKSNKWVRSKGWNVQDAGDPRTVVTDDNRMRVIVVGPKYKCENESCGCLRRHSRKIPRWLVILPRYGYAVEYKKQAPIKKEANLPPTDVKGWDDVDEVRSHSWRERARILKYYGLTQFGKEEDQIARLEEHLRGIGKAKKGKKRKK